MRAGEHNGSSDDENTGRRFNEPEPSRFGFHGDDHPGRPRVLFIGWPESSHTTSWIDLLEGSDFNVRLFSLPSVWPAETWRVRSYLTAPGLPKRREPTRLTVYPPERAVVEFRDVKTLENALAKVISDWRPDVIHTLGFEPASYLYLRTRDALGLRGIGRWVAQARGGPDIALNWYLAEARAKMCEVFRECDHFIADNQQNYDLAERAGLDPCKVAEPGMGVVSGAGGIDVDDLRSRWTAPPSQRERVIVWPKAYEINTAKAMPVFEAITKNWARIAPCRIEMLWMTHNDVRIWFEKLFPPALKEHCIPHLRLTREETLDHLSKARVMIAPSLSDGIPNAMMEAMALGAAPLVSPLDTITPVVEAEKNVLFARNLYPDEIGEQLVRLMTDDALVDRMALANVERVREMADRRRVRARALRFYEEVATRARFGSTEARALPLRPSAPQIEPRSPGPQQIGGDGDRHSDGADLLRLRRDRDLLESAVSRLTSAMTTEVDAAHRRANLFAWRSAIVAESYAKFWSDLQVVKPNWNPLARRRRSPSPDPWLDHRFLCHAVAASGLFDAAQYVQDNPDVSGAGLDPLLHFVRFGGQEGRRPSDRFDCQRYLDENPDVAAQRCNPLLHYIQFGVVEGRGSGCVTS